MKPTPEQDAAITAYLAGGDLVVQAGAGTGKTSTLRAMAEQTPHDSTLYLAFNRAIVDEAKAKMPSNVTPATAHSLAFRALDTAHRDRLKSGARMRGQQLAKHLGVTPLDITVGDKRRRLAAGWVAGHVMRGIERFCQTADARPTGRHIPHVDGIDFAHPETGEMSYANNRALQAHAGTWIGAAWDDLMSSTGVLPYRHSHYLKAWQLSGPRLGFDRILVDEAQDLNPCMAAIVDTQTHTSRVWVGDSCQQIYSWNGAVNALERPDAPSVWLTQSFRFGQAIADAANGVLARLDTPLRMTGNPAMSSQVGPIAQPRVVLARTNAEVVGRALAAMADGRQVAIVGGAAEVVRFAEAARQLRAEGWTSHPELSCFGSWGEVLDYADQDPNGSELSASVRLITDWGIDALLGAFKVETPENKADLLVSTAHKAKGREWAQVALADDFPPYPKQDAKQVPDEEKRLLYVALTRAMDRLDADHPWIGQTSEVPA